MGARYVEGKIPRQEGTGIYIDNENREIGVRLRAENNLIICNDDNELYTDLQLADGLTGADSVPVGVLTGRVIQSNGWPQTGTLLSWKTTSGDLNQFLYGNDGKLYFRDGNGQWKTLLLSDGTYKTAVITDDGQGNVSLAMQYLILEQAMVQDANSIEWLFNHIGQGGSVHILIVDSLPATGQADTIYFVSDGQGGYNQYVWDAANNTWINTGGISIDLSNYVDRSTNQTIGGQKTFLLEPVLPSKSSAPTNNPISPATEAQLFNLAQDLAGKQDALTAGDGIDISNNVVSIYSTPATQGQVLTKGPNGVEWTTPQVGPTYNDGIGIDIDSNNDINIDTNGASTGDVLKKTNNGVGWDSIEEFEPDNTGTPGQVLKKTANGYEWENESGGGGTSYNAGVGIDIDGNNYINIDTTGGTNGQMLTTDGQGGVIWTTPPTAQTYHDGIGIDIDSSNNVNIDTTGASSGQVLAANGSGGVYWTNQQGGGGGGGHTYYAGDGIAIDSSYNISINKTGASQGKVMSVDSNGNIAWINQAVANARIFYALDTENVDTSYRDATIVDPSTMTAVSGTFTLQDGDIIFVYFQNGCKIGGTYEEKDQQGVIHYYQNTTNPALNINNNGSKPIFVANYNADYYYFHIGQGTWIMMMYQGNKLTAINTNEVVNVYPGEAWRLPDAIRELKRTRVDISQSEYTALVNTGQVDPDCWYYIHADNV